MSTEPSWLSPRAAPAPRRRWYEVDAAYMGLLLGAALGWSAAVQHHDHDLQFAVIAANGRAEVDRLSAHALARQLEACELSKQPRRWPR